MPGAATRWRAHGSASSRTSSTWAGPRIPTSRASSRSHRTSSCSTPRRTDARTTQRSSPRASRCTCFGSGRSPTWGPSSASSPSGSGWRGRSARSARLVRRLAARSCRSGADPGWCSARPPTGPRSCRTSGSRRSPPGSGPIPRSSTRTSWRCAATSCSRRASPTPSAPAGWELEVFGPVELLDGKDLFWWGARTPGAIARLGDQLGAPTHRRWAHAPGRPARCCPSAS